MKQGNEVSMRMRKMLCPGESADEKTFLCKVLKYDETKERIFLILENAAVTDISLDAIYECRIWEGESGLRCSGRIRKRYHDEHGLILEFKIENGFYKINLNSVDK